MELVDANTVVFFFSSPVSIRQRSKKKVIQGNFHTIVVSEV